MATKENLFVEEVKILLASAKSELKETLSSTTLSKNTVHTKTYNVRREIKRLTVIHALLSVVPQELLDTMMKKNKDFADALLSIINPEDGGSKITVKEGDTLLGLIHANPGAKDVVNRAMKYASKAGLKLGADNNTFVKA